MAISFTSYGAAEEVTGSKHLFSVNNQNILVDCGMFQGHRAECYEKNRVLPFSPKEIDAVLLSHGHFDHCGNLPSLTMNGYDGNIYSTTATRDIANLIMMDSAHIMAKDYEYMRKKKRASFKPIYTERDVLKVLNNFVTLNYHRKFMVANNLFCEFLNAGHILGSSVVSLNIKRRNDEIRVAFTGDIGRPKMPILAAPDPLPNVDYLICEGTYGNRLHDPISQSHHKLAMIIRDTINSGGKVIIPSFAVGRTQELVYFLHVLKDRKKIPDVDIFVDSPMAVNATGIFKVHQECYNESVRQAFIDHHTNPFGFKKLTYITDINKSMELNKRTEPCIIISSSGMCEAGRIQHHLKNNISNPNNSIVIVGYMAENTLGRALVERQPVVKIFGNPYSLKARVHILNTFSAHADYNDILHYVKAMDLKRLRKIFLVHGERDALANLRELLLGIGVKKVEVVKANKKYLLVP